MGKNTTIFDLEMNLLQNFGIQLKESRRDDPNSSEVSTSAKKQPQILFLPQSAFQM